FNLACGLIHFSPSQVLILYHPPLLASMTFTVCGEMYPIVFDPKVDLLNNGIFFVTFNETPSGAIHLAPFGVRILYQPSLLFSNIVTVWGAIFPDVFAIKEGVSYKVNVFVTLSTFTVGAGG